eukprot:6757277-Alexandrium_andersonii.AAC.1
MASPFPLALAGRLALLGPRVPRIAPQAAVLSAGGSKAQSGHRHAEPTRPLEVRPGSARSDAMLQ